MNNTNNVIMKKDNRISQKSITLNKLLKTLIYVYFFLSPFEFVLIGDFGSYLKFYGLFIMFLSLLNFIIINKHIKVANYMITLLLWLVVSFITLMWSPDFYSGFRWILSIGNILLMTFVLYNLNWDKTSIKKLFSYYSIAITLFSVLTITNEAIYHGRGIRHTLMLFGNEIDPNGAAAFIVPIIMLFLTDMLKNKIRLYKIVIIAINLIAMLMFASRGAMVSLITTSILTIFILSIKFKLKNKIKLIISSIVIISVAAFIVYVNVDVEILNRIFDFEEAVETGGSGRLDIWRGAWSLFVSNPIKGLGFGGHMFRTNKVVHNMYLSTLVDTGITGFALFIVSIVLILIETIKLRNVELFAFVTSILVIIFFLDVHSHKYFWNVIMLITIVISQNYNKTKQNLCQDKTMNPENITS